VLAGRAQRRGDARQEREPFSAPLDIQRAAQARRGACHIAALQVVERVQAPLDSVGIVRLVG